jgi:hypothetical protein
MAIGTLVSRSGVTYAGKVRTYGITHGSISGGPFRVGETVTQTTSGATGIVVYSEALKLFMRSLTGTFNNSAVITGGTSGATATASSTATVQWLTSYVTLARLRDSVTVNSTRASTPIVDFDTAEDDFTDVMTGNQSGTLAGSLNVEPGGATFKLFEQAYLGNLEMAVRRVQVDRAGTNTRTKYYVGLLSDFNETDSIGDVSTVSFTVALSDQSLTDPTA